jgi:hypothetical protein
MPITVGDKDGIPAGLGYQAPDYTAAQLAEMAQKRQHDHMAGLALVTVILLLVAFVYWRFVLPFLRRRRKARLALAIMLTWFAAVWLSDEIAGWSRDMLADQVWLVYLLPLLLSAVAVPLFTWAKAEPPAPR